MALILTDPTALIDGGDSGTTFNAPLSLSTAGKTITITPGSGILPASADGVTLQALYSALKILWKNNNTYIKYPFPIEMITPESGEVINGWAFANETTRKAIRTAGWVERNSGGSIIKMFAGIISLGSLGAADQSYYQHTLGAASVDFTFPGPVNESIQIIEDPNGDGNYADGYDRRSYLRLFAREYQKTYSSSQLSDIGVSSMTSIVYRFPLANATDSLKITHADIIVSTDPPYDQIDITWQRDSNNSYSLYNVIGNYSPSSVSYILSDVVKDTSNNRWYKCKLAYTSDATLPNANSTNWEAYEGERILGSTYFPFTVIIDADNTVAAAESGEVRLAQLYERIQYELRLGSDIDDNANGSVVGKTAESLLRFVGDTLVTSPGVFIESVNTGDINSIQFYDSMGVLCSFPFVSSGTLQFNSNLSTDDSAIYRLYFSTLPGGKDFGTANATLVKDSLGVDISGTIDNNSTIAWSFAYDSNNQEGRTPGTDAAVTLVAIGLADSTYATATSLITKATGQNISISGAVERNYINA